MPMRRHIFLPFLLIAYLFITAAPAWALDVLSVRFGVNSGRERVVIELSAKAEFRAFVMTDPNRIVIDMKNFGWRVDAPPQTSNTLISDVRYGPLGNGQGRLVLETRQPVVIKSAFSISRVANLPDRIVIDFTPVSAETMAKAQDQVIGQLNATGPKAKPGASSPAEPAAKKSRRKPMVIIDPGHGGQDPGAMGVNGMYEKALVLSVALELRKQLESSGYDVRLTREKDIFIPLRDRVMYARKKKGDLFISLHADSIQKADVSGASVYTLSEKASDAEAEKLAERENKSDMIAGIDLSHQEADVANILIDLAARDTMNQSRFMAGTVLTTFSAQGVSTLDRTPRSAGFAVLKAMDIPSILVEMGYLTNQLEVNRLSTPAYRKKIATALKHSVDVYFQKVGMPK